MRVTDEMVDAAIAADSHASWWAGNNREGAEKRMRAALEAALAVEGTEAEPVVWRHKYTDPGSGKPVWRDRGGLWNGQMPEESQPLYTTPPTGIREALRGATVALIGAHSLLSKSPKTAAPSNKMFDQMLADYQLAIDRARDALRGQS